MAVSFANIPSTLRVPLFYAEVDASRANIAQIRQRALLVGQMITTGGAGVQGAATANTPVLVRSAAEARSLFGPGSHLALMADVFRQNDDVSELWALPVADAGGSVAATSAMVVTGPSTASGTISIYIAGRRVQVGVSSGQASTAIATAIGAAVNADTTLPVTAGVVSSTVTLTAKNKGTLGNGIDLRLNYGGAAAGEALPAGVGVTTPAFASGATDPTFTTAFTALADDDFDFIAFPYTDTTSLDAIGALLNDTTGRWAWSRQIYGHAFSAAAGSTGTLVTLGNARNDQHVTIIGYNGSPSHVIDWTAALTAQACKSLSIDPARPLQTLPLIGVRAPPIASRFTISDRQTLYADGVASYTVRTDGTVQIDRAITTYQVNAFGQADVSYLDVETLFTLAYILRRLRIAISSKYGRHKLANDGTRFGAGQAIVTPAILKAEILSEYRTMEELGIVENIDLFKSNLVVERNITDPNRVDVLLPPDLVNGLRVFAVLAQFRLQY
jgi:phage tail sheath gpL-like